MAAIEDVFDSELAREIIEAEFFSSDDQFGGSQIGSIAMPGQQSQSDLHNISEEQESVQIDRIVDQKALIDAEIERIRKRCDIQYHVNVD